MKKVIKKLILGKHADTPFKAEENIDKRKVNVKAIWENEHHDDFGLEKIIRLFLAGSQFFFPLSYIKHLAGRKGPHAKVIAVDIMVVLKMVLPLFILAFQYEDNKTFLWIQAWLVLETILFIPALVFASDSYSKASSFHRSMLLVFINYLEIIFAFAVFYAHFPCLNKPIDHWYDSVYFSFTTATALGFGDWYPVTFTGKILVSMQAFLFLLFVVIFLNFFSSQVERTGYFKH